MATRTQVETTTPYLVLRFAEHTAQTQRQNPSQSVQPPEKKPGNKLGGRPPVVAVPKPIPPSREAYVKSRLELKILQGREQKIQSLLQKVRAAAAAGGWEEEAEAWIAEFNAYSPDCTEERAISLATFVIEVLTPQRHYALKTLACEILQVMLPDGEPVESFLLACQIGLAKREEFLKRCERENTVASAHFEACRSFEKKEDAQIAEECRLLQERMRALQRVRSQITQGTREEIIVLIQRVNALQEELRAQTTAVRDQDLAESSLHALVTEYHTFLEALKGLK
jgi:hypothetical protein